MDGSRIFTQAMDGWVKDLHARLRAHGLSVFQTFGQVADGNLHFFVKPGRKDARREDCDEDVYGALESFGGTISAEHGIGFEKRAWLLRTRSSQEVGMMRSLKNALDPKGILNPGCVFE